MTKKIFRREKKSPTSNIFKQFNNYGTLLMSALHVAQNTVREINCYELNRSSFQLNKYVYILKQEKNEDFERKKNLVIENN